MTSLADGTVGIGQRESWVDTLRVLVIAGVIVVHTATGYVVDIADWYYDDERTTSEFWSTLLAVPAFPAAVFALGPLFLVAGWFSVGSIDRRGPVGFARTRLVRLGIPLVVFVLVVQPLTDLVGDLLGVPGTLVHYLGTTEVSVMWFAAALLVFSLGYAALEGLRPGASAPRPFRPGVVVTAVVTIALASFALWLVWPLNEDMFLSLRIPAWPQGAVLFALGVHAARGGWLEELPRAVVSRLGWTAVAGVVALVALLALALAPDEGEEFATGADAPTLMFAFLDGLVAVTFTLWFAAWFRRRWPTHGELVGKAGRASYATYFIHPLVLTAVMVLFAWVPLVPELKFVVVAMVTVPTCFAVGYGLTRLPGVSKVL